MPQDKSDNKFPQWLRRFAWDNGFDLQQTVAKAEHEREEILPEDLNGAKEGWRLTGRTIYTIKDNDHQVIITVERRWTSRYGS